MIAKFEIPNIFVACACAVFFPQYAAAQFHTITKGSPVTAEMHRFVAYATENKSDMSLTDDTSIQDSESEAVRVPDRVNAHSVSGSKSQCRPQRHRTRELPELTIPNLIEEIRKNGIRHPKIVLAQAILETGWFKSPVCRNKHNLFGLTNPRTKTYYEFDHWTESVRAYYTKVQYRYKGGNYLLWLRDIGYAEDSGYIRALIRVLRQI